MLNIAKPSRAKTRRKVLGLAVGEESILIAEVSVGTGGFAVTTSAHRDVPRPFEATHLAEFVFPTGMTLADGEPLGAALSAFLKESDISVRHVVFGIPAKWVVVKTKQVPPAEPPVIAESLRLQAEGDFSAALSDLVFDYAGLTSTAETRQVLLMATPKRYVDQVMALAKAANLDVLSVTPSAASLGWATNRSSRDALVLSLGVSGAEFTAQSGTSPSVLRHLGPVPSDGPGPMFLSELRRTASSVPPVVPFAKSLDPKSSGNGDGKTVGGRELIVWNGFSLDKSARQAVGDCLGMPVRAGDLGTLGVSAVGTASAAEPGHYAPAVALALAGLAKAEKEGSVNFLHPRLAPPVKPLIDRRVILGVGIGVLLLLLAVLALHRQHVNQDLLDAETAQWEDMQPAFKTNKTEVDKIEYAKGWEGGEPRDLACLRDLTNAMPDDRQSYLMSLDLQSEVKEGSIVQIRGTIAGKSSYKQAGNLVRDHMSATKNFATVIVSKNQSTDVKNSVEWNFTITFIYTGHD